MLAEQIKVTPIAPALGVEVSGLALDRPLSSACVEQILAAWHRHSVMLIRDQSLGKGDLVRFSSYFGTPVCAAHQERELSSTPDFPEVMIVSNVIENGQSIGHLGNKEAAWHTDMCYTDDPPLASMLYARETPSIGGNTGFLCMYDVLERLPPDLRRRIDGLSLKHDRSYTAVGDLRHGFDPVVDASASPGSIHPIIRTHPATGRQALYLGRRLHAYVVGMSLADSEALLSELWRYVENSQAIWHHAWRPGDILIWDNRCLMHRRDAFDQSERRLMWRTQIRSAG